MIPDDALWYVMRRLNDKPDGLSFNHDIAADAASR